MSFDSDRAYLSHDLWQNSFLAAISFTGTSGLAERSAKLTQAAEGDAERLGQVAAAFGQFQVIRSAILEFLDGFCERYGFVTAPRFTTERDNVEMALAQIENFGIGLLEEHVAADLEEFWRSADTVTAFFAGLAAEQGRYVLDFDPRLVSDHVKRA